MHDSLNSGERPSRQKRITLSEMPNLLTQKIDRIGRNNSRGSAVVPAQRKAVNIVSGRPLRATSRRSQMVLQIGTASSRLQPKDPSTSPEPSMKRDRSERQRPDKRDVLRSSAPSGGVHTTSTRSLSSRTSSRSHVSSSEADSSTLFSDRTMAFSSLPQSCPTATTINTELFDSIIQQQGPQRQTRNRVIDIEKMMKIIIGEGRREEVNCAAIDSAARCGQHSSRASSAAATATSVDDQKDSMEIEKAFSHGRVSVSTCREGIPETSGGSTRRFATRSVSTRSRARGTETSPGLRGTATCGSGTASISQATEAGDGGTVAGSVPEGLISKETVIVPCFRLHNLFGAATEDTGGNLTQSAGDGNADSNSSSTSSPGGAQHDPLPSIGARRKRPVGKATTKPSAGSMAPPHPHSHTCQPRDQPTAGAGDAFKDFLEVTKDSLVRSTHIIFGSDYDMDDEDEEFLETLNGGHRTSGDSRKMQEADLEEISKDLFEAMIERLERQESRARDSQVLAEESDRLREDYDAAEKRVSTLKREADLMCFAGNSNNATADAGAGSGCNRGDDSGNVDCGKNDSSDGNWANHIGRRERKGYVYEEDSCSDEEDDSQARIMRGRGPVILSVEFALPLLRTCVMKHQERVGDGDYHGVSNSNAGGKGAAFRCMRGKASRIGSGGKKEVSASNLIQIFRYWARKRERYGGPMLRCFHEVKRKHWKRMEDPQREAEDLEEGKDPHASSEAFQTLKSLRQDLDKARLVVDCVKRREKLKRSAIRHANSLWKIVDETQDAPRTFRDPSTPPSLTSLTPWSSSSDPKLLPLVYEGPSTRGSSVRLAKAKTDLATSETIQEEEHEGNEETGKETDRKRQQAEASEAGRVGSDFCGARVKPNRAGCVEQEQAWNALARLPARWTGYFDIGGLYQEELEKGEHEGAGSVSTVGRMVTRGLKKREGGEAISGSRGSEAHGLFALYPGRVEGGDITPSDATGGNGGQKLRAGVGRSRIPSDTVPGGKADEKGQEQNHVPPSGTAASPLLGGERGRPSTVDAIGVAPSVLQQQRPRTSVLPPLMGTVRETRSLRYLTRMQQGKRAGVSKEVEAGESGDNGSAVLHNDGDRLGLRGERSRREKRVGIGAPAFDSAVTTVTPEPGEDKPGTAVGMTTRARLRCCYSTPPSNPPSLLSNSRKASGEVESIEEIRVVKRSKMAQSKADRAESEGRKHDVLGALEDDGGWLRNGYRLRSRGRKET